MYGLTHLEEWVWEEESRVKRDGRIATPETEDKLSQPVAVKESVSVHSSATYFAKNAETAVQDSEVVSGSTTEEAQSATFGPWPWDSSNPMSSVALIQTLQNLPSMTDTTSADGKASTPGFHDAKLDSTVHSSPDSDVTSGHSEEMPTSSIASPPTESSRVESATASSNLSSSSAQPSLSSPSPTVDKAPVPTGGESIYRTIMNRVNTIENNHTLYTRYVEEQMSGVREVLSRVAEDIGRLEGIVSSPSPWNHI